MAMLNLKASIAYCIYSWRDAGNYSLLNQDLSFLENTEDPDKHNLIRIKVKKKAKIRRPKTPYGKVIKHKKTSHRREPKASPFKTGETVFSNLIKMRIIEHDKNWGEVYNIRVKVT